MHKSLVLASTSSFRKAQLEQLGFNFITCPPQVDERDLESKFTGSISELPVYLAQAKAQSVIHQHPEKVIIGSDQLLIFAGQSFHKPRSLDEVVERLMQMQGQTHELYTGLCLIKGDEVQTSTTIAKLTMHTLTLKQAQAYVQLDQPIGCAGGYKIEQKGLLLFSKIDTDDFSSITGLPCLSLISILDNWGISRL